MEYPDDVPVHRPSVGAMGLNHIESTFKPYVYRGTGEDRFPETTPSASRKKRKRDPAKIRAANIKRFRKQDLDTAVMAARRAQRLLDEMKQATPSEPLVEPAPIPPTAQRFRYHRTAPAPGWRPLTGSDVDDILNELEVDDEPQTRDTIPLEQPAWRDQATLLGVLHADDWRVL